MNSTLFSFLLPDSITMLGDGGERRDRGRKEVRERESEYRTEKGVRKERK